MSMNAAQLQKNHTLWTYHCLHMTFRLQLALSLVRRCIHLWSGFCRFLVLSNKVYNMWGRVLSSIAKTALCPWLSYSGNYTMDQQSAHTLTDNVYIRMSKKNCIHCFFTQKVFIDHSCRFSTHCHLLLIWLHLFTEFNYFQQVVHK